MLLNELKILFFLETDSHKKTNLYLRPGIPIIIEVYQWKFEVFYIQLFIYKQYGQIWKYH